jgi:hypothetical protein
MLLFERELFRVYGLLFEVCGSSGSYLDGPIGGYSIG